MNRRMCAYDQINVKGRKVTLCPESRHPTKTGANVGCSLRGKANRSQLCQPWFERKNWMCPFQTSDVADLRVSGARVFKWRWGGRAPVTWVVPTFLGKRHHPAFTCLLNSPLRHMHTATWDFSNSPHQHVHHGQGVLNSPSADTGTMAVGFLLSRTMRNEFLFLANEPHLSYSVIATETNQNREFQQTPPSSNWS